jgi:hypothetical protein
MKYMGDKNNYEMKESLSFIFDHITRHVAGIMNKFIFEKKKLTKQHTSGLLASGEFVVLNLIILILEISNIFIEFSVE